jgi:hypothetical protein
MPLHEIIIIIVCVILAFIGVSYYKKTSHEGIVFIVGATLFADSLFHLIMKWIE